MSEYIPEHNLVDILRWLPVKSLLRFRCVSKPWKELLDSHSFRHEHLAVQDPRLLVEYEQPEFLVVDPRTPTLYNTLYYPTEGEQIYSLIGTLHGVVCLYGPPMAEEDGTIHLWNPSTQKLSTLPPPVGNYPLVDEHGNGNCTYSGFWIDPSNKDFKVVLFNLEVSDCNYFYSSIQQGWRTLPLGEVGSFVSVGGCVAVVIEGVAYWAATKDDGQRKHYEVMGVLCFDFARERFDIIEAPTVQHKGSIQPLLCKWKGSPSLVYTDQDRRCGMYLRQEDCWVNMFRINLDSNVSRVLWVMGEMEERRENGMLLATRYGGDAAGELVLCDTRGGFVALKSLRDISFDSYMYVACDYVESLLFP